MWDAAGLRTPPRLLQDARVNEDLLELPRAPEGEVVVHAHATTGLTLRKHPMALLRSRLAELRVRAAGELLGCPDGRLMRYAGNMTLRQQPETANVVIFGSLENERMVQVGCLRCSGSGGAKARWPS